MARRGSNIDAEIDSLFQLPLADRKAIERLLALGARLRKAQTGQLKNADLRALIDEKKPMTAALLTNASAILEEAGHAAPPDAMRRVSATLESLAAWGDMGGGDGVPQAGRGDCRGVGLAARLNRRSSSMTNNDTQEVTTVTPQ